MKFSRIFALALGIAGTGLFALSPMSRADGSHGFPMPIPTFTPHPFPTHIPYPIPTISPHPTPVADTITLSGAVSGTVPCIPITAWQSSNNTTAIVLNPTGVVPGVDSLQLQTYLSGKLTTGTFGSENATLSVAVVQMGRMLWVADKDKGIGSASMTINSLIPTMQSTDQIIYEVHGSYQATLAPATPDAVGTVQVQATF